MESIVWHEKTKELKLQRALTHFNWKYVVICESLSDVDDMHNLLIYCNSIPWKHLGNRRGGKMIQFIGLKTQKYSSLSLSNLWENICIANNLSSYRNRYL